MSPQTPVRAYCQRLQLVALALIIAQLLFLIFAFSIRPPSLVKDVEQQNLITRIGFGVGIVFVVLSFFAARRAAATLDEYQRVFFAGFVLAEIGTLVGLGIFFLLGTTTPLVVLAVGAAASIYAHYASVVRRILASRELNPQG